MFRRQKFNRPYSYIQLFNKTCGEYFDEDYDNAKHSIVWADFSEANNKHSQCQDIANICSKMQKEDVLRITLNANPTGISTGGKETSDVSPQERKKLRFDTLKKELNDYFPDGVNEEDITKKRYPRLLLKVIKKAVYKNLDVDLSPCPLCSYVYSDNTQMMTITIIMCSAGDRESSVTKLEEIFNDWKDYVNIDKWNESIIIDLFSPRFILFILSDFQLFMYCQRRKIDYD